MSQRYVWIIGSIEGGAKAGDIKFHDGQCYVLDQIRNRPWKQKVPLDALPPSFTPCKICSPPGRSKGGTTERVGSSASDTVRVDDEVDVEDLYTEKVTTVTVVADGERTRPGIVSVGSPRGAVLVGKAVGGIAEAVLPNGRAWRVQIVDFRRADAR